MPNEEDRAGEEAGLRLRAEARLRSKPALTPGEAEALSLAEVQRTLQELQVHQIELEMQNEELRLAQLQLDTARARYFDLYDLAPVGYFTLSREGLILEANLTAAGMLGVSKSALIKQPLGRFIHKSGQDAYYLYRRHLDDTGAPWVCELRIAKSDGSLFWAGLESTARQDADGVLICRLVMSDITKRKQADDARRDAEKLLAGGQQLTGLGSYRLNIPVGTWTCSGETSNILGVDDSYPHTVNGWEALIHPESRAQMIDYLTNRVLGEHIRFDKEYRIIRHSDGQERWIHGIGEVEFDDEGRPCALVGAILDITESKQMYARLLHAQRSEAIVLLAGGIAHEFNSLLTVINGYSELTLAGLGADNPLRSKLEKIADAGLRAAELTAQLLAFSRRQLLQPRRLAFDRAVREAGQMLHRVAGKNVEVRFVLDAYNAMVMVDPHQLELVLVNLTSNARDAMPDGGRLMIQTERVERPEAPTGRFVMLTLRDNVCFRQACMKLQAGSW